MPSKTPKKPAAKSQVEPAVKAASKPAPKVVVVAKKPTQTVPVDKTKKATTSFKPLKANVKPAKSAPSPKKVSLVPTKKIAEIKPVIADVAVKKKPGRPAKVADADSAGAKLVVTLLMTGSGIGAEDPAQVVQDHRQCRFTLRLCRPRGA